MIVCAGESESFSFATPIGIGLVNSAINLTKLIMTFCPNKIIFIGTAGAYDEKLKLLDVYNTSMTSNIELGFLQGKSYTPLDNVIGAEKLNGSMIVNSSNYITTDEKLSKKFVEIGISMENMEFFSVVACAMKFNIHVEGIFAITNYCNANAHQEFLNNHFKAKEILTQYVIENKIVSRETLGEK